MGFSLKSTPPAIAQVWNEIKAETFETSFFNIISVPMVLLFPNYCIFVNTWLKQSKEKKKQYHSSSVSSSSSSRFREYLFPPVVNTVPYSPGP